MIWRAVLRIAGALLIVDGVLSIVLGKTYARCWRAAPRPAGRFAALVSALLGFTIRMLGIGQLLLGLKILSSVPLRIQHTYRYWSGWYDLVRGLLLAPGAEKAADSAVRQYLPREGRVLDLGCGTGANLKRMLRLQLSFASYTGVDLTPEMLAVARRRFADIPNATFVRLDLRNEPLPDGDYDLVISTWLLSHIPDPSPLIEKAIAQTKHSGHVVLLFFSRSDTWLDLMADLLLAPISAHPVPRQAYSSFPNKVSVQHFLGGLVTMAVLAKAKDGAATKSKTRAS